MGEKRQIILNFFLPDPPSRPPKIVNTSELLILYEGDSFSLDCEIQGGIPRPNLTWNCNPGIQVIQKRIEGEDKVTNRLTGNVTRTMNGLSCCCSVELIAWEDLPWNRNISVGFQVFCK